LEVNTGQQYQLRFVKEEHYHELINLYHLARTALSGGDCSKHARMVWACKQWAKQHTYITETGAYKDLDGMLHGW
jgi:hypothetical protein